MSATQAVGGVVSVLVSQAVRDEGGECEAASDANSVSRQLSRRSAESRLPLREAA